MLSLKIDKILKEQNKPPIGLENKQEYHKIILEKFAMVKHQQFDLIHLKKFVKL